MVLLLDEEVLRGSERNVGAGKVVGAVARRTPRHNANSPHPVEFCQAERCRQLEVTAVGSLVAAVQTIVASKIRVPCGREEAEVVAYEALPDMGCLVCMILKISAFGEPVVGHTHAESFVFVLESQVQLLGVGTVADAYAAPCREANALVANAKRGLQAEVAKVLTAPDVLADEVGTDGQTHPLPLP